MQKRTYERIPASLVAKFFLCNTLYYGIVTNISENGMCINTGTCFPCGSKVKLRIPLKEEVLEVPVKVSRVVKETNSLYDVMGVEVLNPSERYLQIVDNLKAISKSQDFPTKSLSQQ